ncbi:MAG: 6-carboxytetrahydropterin synthase [Armatimonadetes bacterium]|nr:6-carboxytetrahydropterin synthase [Armatimonadota bacterium]
MIYFGRRVSFSMGHRLHNHALSDAENRAIYGKCNNPNGHGHQYTLEVLVAGEVDPKTGFSANLPLMDEILRREIVERFDHYDFNADFPEYAGVISSGENLARIFWDLIAPHLPLARLRVEETEKNAFEYFGENR